jgi:hypothetical protein
LFRTDLVRMYKFCPFYDFNTFAMAFVEAAYWQRTTRLMPRTFWGTDRQVGAWQIEMDQLLICAKTVRMSPLQTDLS